MTRFATGLECAESGESAVAATAFQSGQFSRSGMNLAGSTAIVTGGAVRIGREIALALARAGMHIGLHYGRSEAAAHSVGEEIRKLGVRCELLQADLLDPAAPQRVFERARALGDIRVLVNSAAIFEPAGLPETSLDLWDRHLAINLRAPFFLTREFAKQLPAAAAGAVVNILDWRGTDPVPGHDAYTITKAGLAAATRLLAQELGPRIRVNGVAPGAILPPPGVSAADFAARERHNPLQRIGGPADISAAVLYLLQADFVTGEILHVTGGEELRRM